MSRVHIISEPLSDYLRWQIGVVYPVSVAAGEDVRILLAGDVDLLGTDFWLMDDHLIEMQYDHEGNFLSARLTDDRAAVADHQAWRDILLRRSILLADYGHDVRRTA